MVIYDRNEKELVIPVGWGDDMEIDEKNRPYKERYFTVEMQTDGLLSFSGTGVFSYSINGGEWEERSVSGARESIIVSSGSTVRISSTSTRFGLSIASEDEHKVYGNVMSLLYGDDFKGKTEVGQYAFFRLLRGDSGLTDASNLILPSTTLAARCYSNMFQNCKNLEKAPVLPATLLAQGCYSDMFNNCSKLKIIPKLPATLLAEGCYSGMFDGCTSILSIIELPAEYLVTNCYSVMFRNTNVQVIKCHAINPGIGNFTGVWLQNVHSTGTFYRPEGVEWRRDASGIPEGWQIKNLE